MIVGSPTILNLVPGGVNKVVHVNQVNDNIEIQFQIMNGSQPYNVTEGVSCTIRGTKGDSYGYTAEAATTVGSNVVTVTLTEQLTAVAGGCNVFELVFVGAENSMKVSTENFILAVERAALGEDTVISDSDLAYAEQVLDQLQSVGAVNAQVQQNKANLAAEISRAQAAEAAEAAARQAADNALQSNINSEASTRATADASLQSQINQLVAPEGSAPSAAEVENARVGADGTVYPTLGDAIRTQDTQLKSALEAISTQTLGENLANPETVTVGSLTSVGGVDATATGYKTSDFIALEANTDYTLTSWRSDTGAITASRKYVALYDSTKTFISGSYQNVNGASFIAFNSGTSGKYVRVTVGNTNNAFVKKGSTAPSAFIAYTEEYSTDMTVEKYKAGSIDPDALSAELQGELLHKGIINLYDSQNATVGVLTSLGRVDATGTVYLTTDFIPIKQGFTYTVSPVCRWKCFYSDATADAFLSYDGTQYNVPHSFVAAFTGYLRFSFLNSASDVSCKESFSGTVTEKIEEGISLSEYQQDQVSALIEAIASLGHNVLYGKKWAVCGDSFTNDGGTGTLMPVGTKYAGHSYTYPWIIGSRQNMEIYQFFEGGRTLAFPADPGTFTNSLTNPNATWYYQNIPADADYITIYLGINDEHHSSSSSGGDGEDNTGIIPIGTIDDNTSATYLGAWNVVLTWLITNRPNAHIGIIVTNGIANKDQYRQGQIAIAEKYGIPYIDMNGDARTPAMLRTSNPNIPANIKQALIEKWSANYPRNQHPNDAAQLFESGFIENFLRSI